MMNISTPLFSSKSYKIQYNISSKDFLGLSNVCICGLELGSRHINSYLALHSINGDLS